MAKCFSKKYGTRDELSTTCNLKVMSRCLSAPDATSLYHCLQNHCQYFTTLLLLLLTGTIFSYFCMSSSSSVLILAILIAIVRFLMIFIVIDDKNFQ